MLNFASTYQIPTSFLSSLNFWDYLVQHLKIFCVCVSLFDYFLFSSSILFVEIFLYCRREGEKDYWSFVVVLQGRIKEDVGVGEVCVWFNFVCLCVTLQKRERLLEWEVFKGGFHANFWCWSLYVWL